MRGLKRHCTLLQDINHLQEHGVEIVPEDSNVPLLEESELEDNPFRLHRPATATDILRRFGKELLTILGALTVYNALFWLPTFCIDWAVYGKISEGKLDLVNVAVNIVFFGILVRVGGRLYSAWKEARAKRLEVQHRKLSMDLA